MNTSLKTPFSYRIGRLAVLFASHVNHESLSLEDDGILLQTGETILRIAHLAIGSGIVLKSGSFWDVLVFHLENNKTVRMGGIGKKRSKRLHAELQQANRHYLSDFYQHLVPEIQNAYQQAHSWFSGERYVRRISVRQWLKTHRNLVKGIQRKDVQRFLPADTVQALHFIRPLLNHGYDAIEHLNETYVERQIETFKPFFDGVESNPLTANQRRACVIDEQHNLVLAAGTGKTSTMTGRAGYLINAGLANSDVSLCPQSGRGNGTANTSQTSHRYADRKNLSQPRQAYHRPS